MSDLNLENNMKNEYFYNKNKNQNSFGSNYSNTGGNNQSTSIATSKKLSQDMYRSYLDAQVNELINKK